MIESNDKEELPFQDKKTYYLLGQNIDSSKAQSILKSMLNFLN